MNEIIGPHEVAAFRAGLQQGGSARLDAAQREAVDQFFFHFEDHVFDMWKAEGLDARVRRAYLVALASAVGLDVRELAALEGVEQRDFVRRRFDDHATGLTDEERQHGVRLITGEDWRLSPGDLADWKVPTTEEGARADLSTVYPMVLRFSDAAFREPLFHTAPRTSRLLRHLGRRDDVRRLETAALRAQTACLKMLPEMVGRRAGKREGRLYAGVEAVIACWRRRSNALAKIGDASGLLAITFAAEASHEDPVLVLGPSGSGKESAARTIHELSVRKDRPFVPANIGGVPESIASTLLFGHKRGAFTGASADHKGYFKVAEAGTVFLDEIGDATRQVQAALLRVLANKEIFPIGAESPHPVDVRVIAATNREDLMSNDGFRDDLYHRLRPDMAVRLEPLSRRSDKDLEKIWRAFAPGGEPLPVEWKLRRQDVDAIRERDWPGNIRQLEYYARAYFRWASCQPLVTEAHVANYLDDRDHMTIDRANRRERPKKGDLDHFLDAIHYSIIVDAVKRHGDDFMRTARSLGITESALRRQYQRLGGRLRPRGRGARGSQRGAN